MKVLVLQPHEIHMVDIAITRAIANREIVRVAVDFDGFKMKLGNGTWSPPIGTVETDD